MKKYINPEIALTQEISADVIMASGTEYGTAIDNALGSSHGISAYDHTFISKFFFSLLQSHCFSAGQAKHILDALSLS